MEASEVLRTTGAVRRFTADPVDDATVRAILDDARFAPSGGNRQGWRVVVVKDRERRRRLADAMQLIWDEYIAVAQTGVTPFSVVAGGAYPRPPAVGTTDGGHVKNDLLYRIEEIPVVLVVAVDLSVVAFMDKDLEHRQPIAGGASVYPFCWSVLLAARARGLGGVLTTFLSRAEPAVADDLGLPPTWALAATLFLGHPVHQPTKLRRHPVESFTTVDRFDGDPFA